MFLVTDKQNPDSWWVYDGIPHMLWATGTHILFIILSYITPLPAAFFRGQNWFGSYIKPYGDLFVNQSDIFILNITTTIILFLIFFLCEVYQEWNMERTGDVGSDWYKPWNWSQGRHQDYLLPLIASVLITISSPSNTPKKTGNVTIINNIISVRYES